MSDVRTTFLATLRAGLRGAPPAAIEDVIADYSAYFDEGTAAKRSEAEIAQALGDPLALADELRVELRIEKWQEKRSARSAINLLGSVLALGVVNTALMIFAVPLLCLLGLTAVLTTVALFLFGAAAPFVHLSIPLPGGVIARLLVSIGSISAGVAVAAITMFCVVVLVNGIGRYAQLHYRILSRHSPKVTS